MTNPKKYIYAHGSTTEWCIEDKTLFYRTSYNNDPWSEWNELPSNQFHQLNPHLIQNLELCLEGFSELLLDKGLNDYDQENNYKDYMAISHTKCDSDQLSILDDK
tara:strand:- start:36 stop:350 length:315 start_codon:yes stop_codon:yes gene_type:complete